MFYFRKWFYSPFIAATYIVILTGAVLTAASGGGGSIRIHPITAQSQVHLEILGRHYASGSQKSSIPIFSCWHNKDAGGCRHFDAVLVEAGGEAKIDISVDITGERTRTQEEDTINMEEEIKNEKLGLLVEHLRALTGYLRISPSFLALLQRNNSTKTDLFFGPHGPRWAIAADHVDLSGIWKPIVTPEFKQTFNDYLVNCSLSFWHRKLLINGISLQTEYIEQRNQGQELEILDKTPAGSWNRTLISSGADLYNDVFEARNVTIMDPNGDFVQVEAWWEEDGSVHKSWLRGKPNSYGGAIETSRYLDGDDTLICESTFHPGSEAPPSFQYAEVIFRFKRAG